MPIVLRNKRDIFIHYKILTKEHSKNGGIHNKHLKRWHNSCNHRRHANNKEAYTIQRKAVDALHVRQ